MCGRYSLGKKPRSWPKDGEEFQPRFNIAPSQQAPVFVSDGSLKQMRWGLIPTWAEDETVGYKMINARAETVAERPAFRRCVEKQRCIVPADGFYEWRKSAGARTPMRFLLQDDEPFAFAGLWERWYPRGRERVESFTILTAEANDLVQPVHDRMPVMLDAEGSAQWLDGGRSFESLRSLLRPFPADRMRHYRVSSRMNDASFEDPSCIEPAPDLQPALPGI
jgi:putative SOS response-associated peptidase YedK